MKNLAIIGASGHGKVVGDLAEQLGYDLSFYDDAFPQRTKVENWPIKGVLNDFLSADKSLFDGVIVAIGDNNVRLKLSQLLFEKGYSMPVLIHPSAVISQYARIGEGSVLLANVVVNAFSVIGRYVILNSSSLVEHDCHIGDGVHISPNSALGGGVKVGNCSWLGIGSTCRHLISIGDYSTIGAGAVVTKNIPSYVTVVGVPAKIMSS